MRNYNPHKYNFEKLSHLTPSMRYREGEDFGQWQKRGREKLEKLLGLPFESCDPDVQIDYVQDRPAYTDTRFSFQSEKGYYVPCHYLCPKEETGKKQVFICLQGHSTGMHQSIAVGKFPGDEEELTGYDLAYGMEALKRGYKVILVELRNFGECGGTKQGPDCYLSSMNALLLGRTTIGERVWDVQRMIDVMEQYFPDLDLSHLACLGLSGGGTAATYVSCLEPRIRYVVIASAFCTFKHSIGAMYHCSCNYVPGIARYFDMGDLGGLLAPRKLIVASGDVDPIFPVEGVMEAYRLTQAQYCAAGAEENCRFYIGNGPHRFFNKEIWDMADDFFAS